MKLLLVCAGGLSTSILMKKLSSYAESQEIPFEVDAVGVGSYEEVYKQYDLILMGPQVSYKKDEVAAATGIPLDVINPLDYALGNAENIFKQIDKLLS